MAKNRSKTTLKTYFFTGILVTAPITITLYVAWELITFVDSRVTSLIPSKYNPNELLPYGVPGLGVVLLLLFFTGVGMLTANFVGQAFIRLGYRMINRMPLISGLYNAVRKILETLLGHGSDKAFRQAVLVEYPRKGVWTIAFVTGNPYDEVIQKTRDHSLVSIYVPTTPNPTSGFFLYVPEESLIKLNINVEEALKLVLSMGIINPTDSDQPDLNQADTSSSRMIPVGHGRENVAEAAVCRQNKKNNKKWKKRY